MTLVPQTDGQTERMSAMIEEYTRNFCTYLQDDWSQWTALAQLAINGRDSSATGISPFFLDHGYHVDPLDLEEEILPTDQTRTQTMTMKQRAEDIVSKMTATLDIAQAELGAAQQRMEDYANRRRDTAPSYRVGDLVWLDLRNISTGRPSKKLDNLHAKYRVPEVVGSHAYRLDTPGQIHDVLHASLLRPAGRNPFPSQQNDDYQPPAQLVDGEEEFLVESILDERVTRRGRRFSKEYLVKWVGYARPTWQKARDMANTEALDRWEARTREEDDEEGD